MAITDDGLAESEVLSDDDNHVFHSWSVQGSRNALPVAGAEGSWFWDYDGNRYLDLASQLVFTNVGHQHPRLVAAVKEQADRLCALAPAFANDKRGEAARSIAKHAPGNLNSVFFTSGGAEANDNAVRMARLHTGRHKILAAYRSYHGATGGSISLTGDPRRWPSEPGMPGMVRFFGPYLYRSHFSAQTEQEECTRALAHLEEILSMEGPQNVAAILVEPVVGTNGILVPPDGYLAGVRQLCDEHGILLIADEVMSGFGRCGEWFAIDRWGVRPDMITFAKGVNSGYVPLGGVVISEEIAATFAERPYPGGSTYSGHPLACAVAVASIKLFEEESLVERSRCLGEEILRPGLSKIAEQHPSVGEVRGLGCFWAIELVANRQSRQMLVPYNAAGAATAPMAAVASAARREGVWLFTHFNRVHVLPPITISDEDLRWGLEVVDRALDVADNYVERASL